MTVPRLIVTVSLVVLPALAEAGGWLLMEAPMTFDANRDIAGVQAWRPLEEWRQVSAHDTARGCEREKDETVALILNPAYTSDDAKFRDKMSKLAAMAMLGLRCVPVR